MATVANTKARIRAILSLFDGVFVYDGTVRNVNSYPAFLVFAGEASHDKPSVDQKVVIRNYDIWGLIKPSEEGRETEAELAVEPWLDAVPALLDPRPGLWLLSQQDPLPGIVEAQIIDDTGFTIIPMAGADHAGCIWTLRVTSEHYLAEGA